MEDERGSERRRRPRRPKGLEVSLVFEWLLLILALLFLVRASIREPRWYPIWLHLSLVLLAVLDAFCWRMLRRALAVRAGLAALCAVCGLGLSIGGMWTLFAPAFQQAAHGLVCFQAFRRWQAPPQADG